MCPNTRMSLQPALHTVHIHIGHTRLELERRSRIDVLRDLIRVLQPSAFGDQFLDFRRPAEPLRAVGEVLGDTEENVVVVFAFAHRAALDGGARRGVEELEVEVGAVGVVEAVDIIGSVVLERSHRLQGRDRIPPAAPYEVRDRTGNDASDGNNREREIQADDHLAFGFFGDVDEENRRGVCGWGDEAKKAVISVGRFEVDDSLVFHSCCLRVG
ncbi:hypothetical protein BDV98DRAFT_576676 [Pterulicium gracile]|uniref:Uncharacterized protein n=1 Tax=Pterulicium gracile TaxID=1884261 RepID=A0A5C3Q3Q4_9AGAR|nr:hypothetical protein BDV98DRAFT_576676 [Pterula gracilis]